MPKEQSNFAHNYKRTAATGVDARALRAHRRSMEWKQSRDQVVLLRRNVEAMSPVLETKNGEHNIKKSRKTSSSADGTSDKVANRKAQLMKWKKEKDERKKIEELQKAKKKPFRVVHFDSEVVPFKNAALQLPKVPAAFDLSAASAKVPFTRSKTVSAEAGHDLPAQRKSRSKANPAAASSSVGVLNTRETRSKSSSTAPQTGAAGKAQKKAASEPKIPDKSKLRTKVPTVKPSAGVGKKELRPAAALERATRSSTRAEVVLGTKPVALSQIQSSSASASSQETPRVFDHSYSRMKKVNLNRGSGSSFAPDNFMFVAPENIKSFSFDKMSASNEALEGEKKLTPESSSLSSDGASAAKRQTRKSTKMTSIPHVTEIEQAPPVSFVPEILSIVPASECVVLVEKLHKPIFSQPFDNAHVGPVFCMMRSIENRPVRMSQRRSLSTSVGENRKGDRSHSDVRRTEDRTDDSLKDDSSPDESPKARYPLRKLKSKEGVARSSVLEKLPDGNDMGHSTKNFPEKMGAGDAASKETAARKRKSVAFKELTKGGEECRIQYAFESEDVLRAAKTPEKKPECGAVVKESGKRGQRSIVPQNDLSMATEGSRGRSAVKLTSSMPVLESDVELAQMTAGEVINNDFAVFKEENTPGRRMGTRRSMRGKLAPNGSTSDSDGATQIDKIAEESMQSDLADESKTKKMKASKNSKKKSMQNLSLESSAVDTNSLVVSQEVMMEAAETNLEANLEVLTEPDSQRAEETENEMMESKVQNVNTAVFQTPSQPIRSIRSRSVALSMISSKRKTPRNIRNSLILRTLSPEEGVEVLRNSPMIEMNRRKLKTPPSGSSTENQMAPVAPMPSFDDIDTDSDLNKVGSFDNPGDVLSSFDTEPTVATSSASTEPLPADGPPAPVECCVKEPVASPAGKEKDGVKRFHDLLSSETDRLEELCSSWKEILISDAEQLSEEVSGQIRTTIGQAELLMAQRFKQFAGLLDDCEFKTSEKEVTCTDLQGFWDMIYYQVQDVIAKFSDLDNLKAANWVVKMLTEPVKPKATRKKAGEGTKPVVAAKATANRPNFAQFRQQLQQQQQQQHKEGKAKANVVETILAASASSEVKTFDGGFFKIDSPVHQKFQSSTEKHSSLVEVGNTPKATSVARAVLQRMTRKSLIQSMLDCELNSTNGDTNAKLISPSQSKRSPILPDEGLQMTSVNRNKQNERSRKSTRKSVCFSDVVTDCNTPVSNFSKYLVPSSDSVISTPDVICQPQDDSLSVDGRSENTPLVDVKMEEVPVKGFIGLKLGFTPGVDGKSRKISSFTPQPTFEKANQMNRSSKKSEANTDLMTFSPFTNTASTNEASGETGRKTQLQRRCSTRRSVANKAKISLL